MSFATEKKLLPKINTLKMYSKQTLDGNVDFLFLRDDKLMFSQTVKMSVNKAKDIVEQIENVLISPGAEFGYKGSAYEKIYLENADGDPFELCLDAVDMEWFQDKYGLYEGYLAKLTINYSDFDEDKFLITRQKSILGKKENVICEFYLAVKNVFPKINSTMIESLLENGDLESFYERIG